MPKQIVPRVPNSKIYKFQCSNCNITYYGEIERHFKVRAGEHISTCPLMGKSVDNNKISSLKLGSHRAINPDSIAKLKINQKLSPKLRQHYFGVNVQTIENYRPFKAFRNYRQFSRR